MPSEGLRLLVLSNFFGQGHGGTPESVLLLARELAGAGISVDVFCNMGLLRDVQILDALPATDDAASFSATALSMSAYAALFIAGSWNHRAPLIALRAALAGIPIVYAAKGCLCRIEFERLRDMRRVPYFLSVEWLLLALARRIVFSSRVEQRAFMLPSWLWRSRAVRLEEPFHGEALSSVAPPDSAAPPDDALTLGFLAEISPRKGLFELIAGLGHYLASHVDTRVRLRIAGQARRGSEVYLQACRALAERNGVAGHIEWVGPVRGAQRRDFYRSLDLFMCPSRFESFGLTPLEALWQGTPVCAAAELGVLEYLRPDAPLLCMPSLRKEDIADSIATFSDNFEEQRNKGRTWEGRHALTRSNAEIAADFARILLDAASA